MRKSLLLLAVALCFTGCDKDMVDWSELDNANKKIEELNDQVASLNDTIAKRDSTIAYKENIIKGSSQEVKKANDDLKSLQQRLDDRDATINNLNARIADLQDEGSTDEGESGQSLESIVKRIDPYFTIIALLVIATGLVWTIILLRKVKKVCHAPAPTNDRDNDEPQPDSTVLGQAVSSQEIMEAKDRKNKYQKGHEDYIKQLKDKEKELESTKGQLEKEKQDNIKKEKEISALNAQVSDLKTAQANTQKTLDKTKKELTDMTESLTKKVAEVRRLEEAQAAFTTQLASVPFAQPYCQNIAKLTEVVKDITDKGTALLDKNLGDKYYIYKALATFTQRLEKFKQMDFATEVKMAAQSHFALKSSTIAGYDQNDPANKLETATKQYFFDTYLKTYVNAAVVLNETLAGMHHLVDGLDASSCKEFDNLRTRLESACSALGIEVDCVKVFDKVGQNTNIKVIRSVNADFGERGQILEINSCSVKLTGGNMPGGEIQVIVKE